MKTELDDAGVLALIAGDRWMMGAFEAVRRLGLPDWWIVAGFLRAKVWDHLHGYDQRTPPGDVDVVFFDPERLPETDRLLERRLAELAPGYPWEVYNQAHTHLFNDDPPYRSTADAIARWAETVSTVGATLRPDGRLELLAPWGIDDLVEMVIRPGRHPDARHEIFEQRLRAKGWRRRWPLARVAR